MLHFSFWQSSVWKLTAIMVMNYPRTMVLNCDSDMCWWPGWHYSNWQAPNTLLPSRSRRLCNFSSSFPSRKSQCGYHEPQKQRKRAASDAHRINSARPRQISFHKGQKHRPNSAQHLSESPEVQWGFSRQHPCPVGCTQGSLPAPSAQVVWCWCSRSSPRCCRQTSFPTHHEKYWLFPELLDWRLSGYTSLQGMNFLCLSPLRKSLCKHQQINTDKCSASWGVFTSSWPGPEAGSQRTTECYTKGVNAAKLNSLAILLHTAR